MTCMMQEGCRHCAPNFPEIFFTVFGKEGGKGGLLGERASQIVFRFELFYFPLQAGVSTGVSDEIFYLH